MVVRTTILLLLAVLPACRETGGRKQEADNIQSLLGNANWKKSFISQKYYATGPVAQLINMPVYSSPDTAFVLQRDTNIQVYAVGELSPPLCDVSPQYLFKSDDMEFFFDMNNDKADAIMNQADNYMYIFTWLDGKVANNKITFSKQGADYTGYYDTAKKNYVAQICFPWKSFNNPPAGDGYVFGFDVAVGDNNDEVKQKAKIAWNSTADLLDKTTRTYGNLFLARDSAIKHGGDTMVSVYRKFITGDSIDSWWQTQPAYPIGHIIAGYLGREDELSAAVKTCWNKDALFFQMVVHDPGRKLVRPEKLRSIPGFSDYGWIEDDKGNKAWVMNVLDSKYAGGADKNRQLDQIIHLRAGRYTLHYLSDESHAWNNWDDEPPQTPFYGIILYYAK